MKIELTNEARALLAQARRESAALEHDYVGTRHLLLAFLRDHASDRVSVLEQVSPVPLQALRARVLENNSPGGATVLAAGVSYTVRAKKAINCAVAECKEAGTSRIGTEHVLSGLIREGGGVAYQVLDHFGVTLADARVPYQR